MLATKGNGRTDNRTQRQEGINGWNSECWTSRANPLLLCVYCIPYVTTQSSPYFAPDIIRQCEGYIRNRKHDRSFKKYHLFRGYQGLLHKLVSRWSANTGGIQLTGCTGASKVQKKEGHSMLLCSWECFSGLSASLTYPWWGVNPLQLQDTHRHHLSFRPRLYHLCRFPFPAWPLNCLSPPLRDCKLLESSHLIVSSTAHDRVLVQQQLRGIKHLSGLLGEVVLNLMWGVTESHSKTIQKIICSKII